MPPKTPKPPASPKPPPAGNSKKNSSMPERLAPFAFKPGVSGNVQGRPLGDGKLRKLLNKTLTMSAKQAETALCRRWGSVKYVQDMAEFLARLEGELTKDAAAKGNIAVIFLSNTGTRPLGPEIFRAAAARQKELETGGPVGDEDA